MGKILSYKKLLVITLWLVALHSIGVGIGMILLPTNWISYFDITPSSHRFFITQGGVFHLIMAVAYFIAAINVKENSNLILFSIFVKFSATFFLIIYFIFINHFGIVFLSGIGDFCMGLVLLVLYNNYKLELT